jgi:type IV pilus assembly protein PilB
MALKDLFQKQPLKDVLIGKGLLTEEQWQRVEERMASDMCSEFLAVSKEFGTKEVSIALAEYANVEFIPLREIPKVSQDIIMALPHTIVLNSHIFPLSYNEDNTAIKIAFADPTDNTIIENLELRLNKEVEPCHGSWDDIDAMLSKYYGSAEALEAAERYTESLGLSDDAGLGQQFELSADSPIIKVVNSILEQAAKLKTSDIHIEPFDTFLRIRYRIDGALVEQPSFPKSMHTAIIARLKVMGGMDISEKRIPQDGRITFMVDKVEYDIRVSMLPTVYGEKCVMRLAIRANLQRDKKDLGLTPHDLKLFNKIFANPNGIILVTGPTGSGKSTTLYTALSELSTEEVNVVTVEDPVEANVDGVNQVHTNAKAGLTFASALRSILRQDPDIIMIGEIRDGETAEIAVQAAITGHLVVSTLHTNSSSATISRLVNMGIAPYLVADSVVGIFAQRLVRRLCQECKKPRQMTDEDAKELGLKPGLKLTIYEKGGCPYCNNTGFKGRIAVYEIMDVGPEIKAMIQENASSAEIKKVAVANGMHTLHRSAAELVIKGITTISEMRKVSSET